MTCRECGATHDGTWYSVALCDRCLKARCWENLEADEYVLVRRTAKGRVTLHQHHARGDEMRDLSWFGGDPVIETEAAVREMFR